jgi:hypothetical protein
MRPLMYIALGALLLSTSALAQAPPDPALQKAVEAREAALAAGDADTWGRFTTDDFMRI